MPYVVFRDLGVEASLERVSLEIHVSVPTIQDPILQAS